MAGKTRPATTTKKPRVDKPEAKQTKKPRKKSTRKAKRASVGRPELISPAIVESIVLAIRIGAPVETAVAHAGIARSTFYAWLKQGARDKRSKNPRTRRSAYAAFSDTVDKALADAELGHLGVIAEAARGREAEPALVDERTGKILKAAQAERKPEWQASAWWLERRHPDRYARRVIHVSEGDGPGVPRGNAPQAQTPTAILPGMADAMEPVFTLMLPPEDPIIVPGLAQLQPPPTGPASDGET